MKQGVCGLTEALAEWKTVIIQQYLDEKELSEVTLPKGHYQTSCQRFFKKGTVQNHIFQKCVNATVHCRLPLP